nr:MAG TPA: hypothetical protein [Crassvirales sp.]
MGKGFHEFKEELLQQINAEMEDACYQLITVEEFKECLNLRNKVTECTDIIELLRLAQTFYRACLFRVHDLESPTAKTSLEYYLRKLQEVRRELYG